MSRPRSITRDRAVVEITAAQGPPATVGSGIRRALTLERAIESSLKGGICPACGARVGRNVRAHFESCDGGRA